MFQDPKLQNNCSLYVSGPKIPINVIYTFQDQYPKLTIIYIFQDQEHHNLIFIVKILIFILNGNII